MRFQFSNSNDSTWEFCDSFPTLEKNVLEFQNSFQDMISFEQVI